LKLFDRDLDQTLQSTVLKTDPEKNALINKKKSPHPVPDPAPNIYGHLYPGQGFGTFVNC
jgi:hypothetical protein